MSVTAPHELVSGASGLLGRHRVPAVHESGIRVSTANRSRSSYERPRAWLSAHGLSRVAPEGLGEEAGTISGRSGDLERCHRVLDNCAGAYRFGMSEGEARQEMSTRL